MKVAIFVLDSRTHHHSVLQWAVDYKALARSTSTTMLSMYAILCCCSLVLLLYKLNNLFRYVSLARKTGLRYTVTPFLETEIIAFLLTPILRYIYHDHLNKGTGWPRWCRFIIKDWSWEDKRLAHDEYGDVFLCVSPEGIICYSADAAMCWEVMNRRNEFTKASRQIQ